MTEPTIRNIQCRWCDGLVHPMNWGAHEDIEKALDAIVAEGCPNTLEKLFEAVLRRIRGKGNPGEVMRLIAHRRLP